MLLQFGSDVGNRCKLVLPHALDDLVVFGNSLMQLLNEFLLLNLQLSDLLLALLSLFHNLRSLHFSVLLDHHHLGLEFVQLHQSGCLSVAVHLLSSLMRLDSQFGFVIIPLCKLLIFLIHGLFKLEIVNGKVQSPLLNRLFGLFPRLVVLFPLINNLQLPLLGPLNLHAQIFISFF